MGIVTITTIGMMTGTNIIMIMVNGMTGGNWAANQ